jgi:hypothetical protein
MARISTLLVLSSALAVLSGGALPSIARAIEIKTPQVTMPHVSVPQVKSPQLNTRINAPQLNTHATVRKVNSETVGGAKTTVVGTSKSVIVGSANTTTVGARKSVTVGGATLTTVGTPRSESVGGAILPTVGAGKSEIVSKTPNSSSQQIFTTSTTSTRNTAVQLGNGVTGQKLPQTGS